MSVRSGSDETVEVPFPPTPPSIPSSMSSNSDGERYALDGNASSYDSSDMSIIDNDVTEVLPSFRIGTQTVQTYELNCVWVDADLTRWGQVAYLTEPGEIVSAMVNIADFNEPGKKHVYSYKPMAHPGMGLVEQDHDGELYFQVLGIYDFNETQDTVYVSWAGMATPTYTWIPRDDLPDEFSADVNAIRAEVAEAFPVTSDDRLARNEQYRE